MNYARAAAASLSAQTPGQLERARKLLERFPEADTTKDASPINHLDKDDRPPVHMSYSRPNTPVTESTSPNEWIHHALFGLKLQEAMQKLDLECIVVHPGLRNGSYKNLPDFLITKLKDTSPAGK